MQVLSAEALMGGALLFVQCYPVLVVVFGSAVTTQIILNNARIAFQRSLAGRCSDSTSAFRKLILSSSKSFLPTLKNR